ncbi:SAF domain-containing protein [Microbacterium sp. A8/3-1]|uniref:SAF domain-containing protein n=1 Tax=Microbacterium sp. A8/3-1 TaxID=3160749 RepID=A0AAU7VZL4_9MICO
MAVLSRPRRAFWGDVRFLIGIALVIVSITGVWLIVSASDDAAPVLQANRTITEGEALTSGDFQVVEVGLGALADDYLGPQDLQQGQVASRTLERGEIVPTSATTDAAESRSTTIVIESSTGIPEDVVSGAVVEVWHAPPLEDGRSYDVPRILVAEVIVRDVLEDDTVLADASTRVEIVIDRSDVADVLAAVTGSSSLSVVPVRSAR